FDSKKNEFNKPEEVKAYHILIKGDDDKALKKIKEIKAKVTPANFKSIASKETEDPSGLKKEGTLGWFAPGRMVPEFDKVAFSQKKGTISEPVKTQFGYHLIYVEDKKAAVTKTFDQVKDQIAEENVRKRKNKEL